MMNYLFSQRYAIFFERFEEAKALLKFTSFFGKYEVKNKFRKAEVDQFKKQKYLKDREHI